MDLVSNPEDDEGAKILAATMPVTAVALIVVLTRSMFEVMLSVILVLMCVFYLVSFAT